MTPGLLNALNASSSTLLRGFNQATVIACHEAWRRARPALPHEPDLVAMLVLEGTPYIAQALSSTLAPHGIRVAVSSIFCHQRPMVAFDRGKRRCELGDVLFVHVHTAARPHRVFRNSLLLQAKLVAGAVSTISSWQDQVQLELYASWPRFVYERSGPRLNGQQRDVKPKAHHHGAQYLLVDKSGPASLASGFFGLKGTYPMAVWPAMVTLCASQSFEDELLRTLMGASGRAFVEFGGTDASGWSNVVWDLLTYGVASAFNRRRVGLESSSRAVGDALAEDLDGVSFCSPSVGRSRESDAEGFLERARQLTRKQGQPPVAESPTALDDQGEYGGVSVVLIETSEE